MSTNNKEYRSLMFVKIRLELELKNASTESFKILLLMFISSLGYTRNKKLLGKPILTFPEFLPFKMEDEKIIFVCSFSLFCKQNCFVTRLFSLIA